MVRAEALLFPIGRVSAVAAAPEVSSKSDLVSLVVTLLKALLALDAQVKHLASLALK